MIDTLCKAIDTYGEEMQMVVAIEELSELQKELCKLLRGYDSAVISAAEEMADVEIMLEQVRIMLTRKDASFQEAVNGYKEAKLARLRRKLEGG